MAKNIVLRNENEEILYPVTKKENIIDEDGSPFEAQGVLTAGIGLNISGDNVISSAITINNSDPDENGNFNVDTVTRVIDDFPGEGRTNALVSSDGIYNAINQIKTILHTWNLSVSSSQEIIDVYLNAKENGMVVKTQLKKLTTGGALIEETYPLFVFEGVASIPQPSGPDITRPVINAYYMDKEGELNDIEDIVFGEPGAVVLNRWYVIVYAVDFASEVEH